MTRDPIPLHTIPDWFLKTLGVVEDARREACNIDTLLRHAMALEPIDPRLKQDVEQARAAMGAVETRLTLMDSTARRFLSELARPQLRQRRFVSVR